MFVIAYASFLILSSICTALHYLVFTKKPKSTPIENALFLAFQRRYLTAYCLALMGDWLQGPYLYKLYHHYGFLEPQIAVLYVCGYAATVLAATVTPLLVDRIGRKKMCIAFTIAYTVCCLTKLSTNYGLLIVGRILGGISTALLFTVYEAWYVHEHIETNDFPKEWLSDTFTKASLANGAIGVGAGILTTFVAEWCGFGSVAPFVLAIPFLIASGMYVHTHWTENWGAAKTKFKPICLEGLKQIVLDKKVLLIGLVQSLFESVVYIFVFLWTPVLLPARPPLGIVFATFMVASMIGGVLYSLLGLQRWPVRQTLTAVMCAATVALIGAVLFSSHPRLSFGMYLLLELCCGAYFPAMSQLRKSVLPEAHRDGVLNWFRVPLNLTASLVILLLHDTGGGAPKIFGVCAGLMAGGVALMLIYSSLSDKDEALDDSSEDV